MSRKDYEAIAKALKASKPLVSDRASHAQWQYTVRHIVDQISLDNIHFDAAKFYAACDYE